MTTQDLAKAFTEMCSKGEFDAAGKKYWSDDIVSREPMTGDMAELKGRKAVEGKGAWWYANHTCTISRSRVPMCTAISSSCASRWT
jgi:SnoaL-like protein